MGAGTTNGNGSDLPPLDEGHVLVDAWREVLGEVLAERQRSWDRERARMEAEAAAIVAGLRAELVTLRAEFERVVNERLSALRDGRPGAPGPKGEPGPPGRDGRLRKVAEWSGGVHYEGDVVAHAGGTWQCIKDTGCAPPHDDWVCLARAGRDGQTPVVRGTWTSAGDYRKLDVVAFSGGSYIAKRDTPGEIPGEGWQAITLPGKRGHQGPSGERGERGPPGPPGPTITGWVIDTEGYSARPIMSDGSPGVLLELRSLFEQYDNEVH